MTHITRLSISDVSEIYKSSWKLSGQHFLRYLGLVGFYFFIFILAGSFPFIGNLISAGLAPILAVGFLVASKRVFDTQTLEVTDLFIAFKNQNLVKKLLPLIIFVVAFNALFTIYLYLSPQQPDQSFLVQLMRTKDLAASVESIRWLELLFYVLSVVILPSAVFFSAPLMFFRSEKFLASIELNFLALFENTKALLFYMLLGFILLLPIIGAALYFLFVAVAPYLNPTLPPETFDFSNPLFWLTIVLVIIYSLILLFRTMPLHYLLVKKSFKRLSLSFLPKIRLSPADLRHSYFHFLD